MRIYLDHNASTPIAPEVVVAMEPFLAGDFGNPSSGHWASRRAALALTNARQQVAAMIGAVPSEIFFTSGGTESNNWAIKGVVARAVRERGLAEPHAVISAVEHPSVRNPCQYLRAAGLRTTEVPVDRHGLVDPDDIRSVIEPGTVLVSVMHANNEVGTIQPIAEIAAVARERGILFHSDAAQSIGKTPVDVNALGVDLLTLAGHKLYAPKGIGALYVRENTPIDPLLHGGGHERGLRAGTENVLFAVALGKAAELVCATRDEQRLRALVAHFWDELVASFGDRVTLIGHPHQRLPNTLNVGFVGRIGADILSSLPALAASTGSACDAGQQTMSAVLTAMGVSPEVGLGAIRFSLGRSTSRAEIDRALALLRTTYEHP